MLWQCMLLAAALSQSQAAIPVGTVQTFDALPATADWATFNLTGGGSTYEDFDALRTAVINRTADSINAALTTDTATTPATQNIARWNSALFVLQTRPTGNSAVLLKAVLQNTTGAELPRLRLSYDMNALNQVGENCLGYQVYYSVSGEANSWVLIPELSTNATAGKYTAILNFDSPWAAGANLYLMWADDNDNGETDGSFTIDNFLADDPAPRPIVITREPVGTNVLVFRPFSLSVEVTGTDPLYQWYKKEGGIDTAITDATNATYSVTEAAESSAGEYFIVIMNEVSTVTSARVTVNVNMDGTPPTIVAVTGSANLTEVTVQFSEAMDASALETFNYLFNPAEFGVSGVRLTNNDTVVVLTTDMPQTPGTTYTLTTMGLMDKANNGLEGTEKQFTAWVTNHFGGVVFEVYTNLHTSDNALAQLTNNAKYPNLPGATFFMSNFNTREAYPDDTHEGYGGRLRSLFIPQVTGQYRFFISSDDLSMLSFNPNGTDPAGATMIAFETGCCQPFLEPPAMQTSSNSYALEAGKAYYLEALFKEGTGGDYVRVGARLEGFGIPTSAVTNLFGTDVGAMAIPANLVTTPTISQQPADVTVVIPSSATFTVAAQSTPAMPFVYQWQRSDAGGEFIDIPGAFGASYRLDSVTVEADNGARFRAIARAPGGVVTSQPATLTVNPDTTAPRLVSAQQAGNGTTIVIEFNEDMDTGSAAEAWNYTVCEAFNSAVCLEVLSAAVNGNKVTIETSPATPNVVYRLTVSEMVADARGNELGVPASIGVGIVVTFQQGDTFGYSGTVDTHIRSDNATTAYGTAVAALADNLSPLSHALLRFDNIFGTGPGQIPADAPIVSATLRVRTDNWGNDIRVYRMLVPWNNDSTWNTVGSANDGVSLTAGDAVATPEITFAPVAVGTFVDVDVTASVKFWATNSASNFGWVLVDSGDDGYQFNSSEAVDPTYRPKLLVGFRTVTDTNPVVIVTQPAPTTTINEGQNATFSVQVTGTMPKFQWYKDDAAIADATNASYTVTAAHPSAAGKYYVRISNILGSQQSADAMLTVVADTTAPTILSVKGGRDTNTTIVVAFSEAVAAASAEVVGNYELVGPGGLTIQSAVLQGNNVVLTLSGPRVADQNYKLSVHGVTDVSAALNPIQPVTLPVTRLAGLIAIETHSWKYLQQTEYGSVPPCLEGNEWKSPTFDDSTWQAGFGLFYGERATNQPGTLNGSVINTYVNVFTNGANAIQQTNYYFRTTFTLPVAATNGVRLLMHNMIDDGAVFYLNGTRLTDVRYTTPDPLTCTNFATSGGNQTWEPALDAEGRDIGSIGLLPGMNTLAVQVAQNNGTSSDITFGLMLEAEVTETEVPAKLNYTFDGAAKTVTLTWDKAEFVLETSATVNGSYTLAGKTSPATINIGAGNQFFRLRKP